MMRLGEHGYRNLEGQHHWYELLDGRNDKTYRRGVTVHLYDVIKFDLYLRR